MGILVYSLLWVMQDLYHQPHDDTHQESLVARASAKLIPSGSSGNPRGQDVRQQAVYIHCITHRLLSSSFLWFIESCKVIPKKNYLGAYG